LRFLVTSLRPTLASRPPSQTSIPTTPLPATIVRARDSLTDVVADAVVVVVETPLVDAVEVSAAVITEAGVDVVVDDAAVPMVLPQ
jgi:hypothetical protein